MKEQMNVRRPSEQRFLVDTGAAVSVFPHRSSAAPSGPPLTGADGRSIPSWGSVKKTLSFGLRTFSCSFILAAVSKPILGVDFLAAHCLLVDPFSQQVLDSETLLPITPSVSAPPRHSRFAAALCHVAPAVRTLLSSFPTIVGDGPAGQSLQRHAVWIRRNTGLRKRNSARLKKPELSAAPILLGHHHCIWFRNRMVLGVHAAIIADSILPRYTTGTLSRPSWTYPQG
jgi:hypothetical protein